MARRSREKDASEAMQSLLPGTGCVGTSEQAKAEGNTVVSGICGGGGSGGRGV